MKIIVVISKRKREKKKIKERKKVWSFCIVLETELKYLVSVISFILLKKN